MIKAYQLLKLASMVRYNQIYAYQKRFIISGIDKNLPQALKPQGLGK